MYSLGIMESSSVPPELRLKGTPLPSSPLPLHTTTSIRPTQPLSSQLPRPSPSISPTPIVMAPSSFSMTIAPLMSSVHDISPSLTAEGTPSTKEIVESSEEYSGFFSSDSEADRLSTSVAIETTQSILQSQQDGK